MFRMLDCYRGAILNSFYFLLLSNCLTPNIVNESKEPFGTQHDKEALKRAKLTCNRRYYGCLKTFTKKEPQRFWAICSKEHKE